MTNNNRHTTFMFNFFIAVLLLISISACSIKTVEPWQRATLAQERMQLDAFPLESQTDAQIESSRENSRGGSTFGGGGCGCN